MLGRNSIDRELGLPDSGDVAAGRESWLSDWPLLLGMVLSAALIVASIALGGSRAEPAAAHAKQPNPAMAVSGEVVDVGEPEPAAPAPGAAPTKAKKAKKTKAATTSDESTAGTGSSVAASDPSSTSSATGGAASGSTTKRSTGSTGGGGSRTATPKTGRIVNVTGTSAAFTNGPLAYTFSAPTHTPVVGKPWRLQIALKRSGRPADAKVKIDILHAGTVVGHVTDGPLRGGRFAHDFDWPQESVGHPLTVKTTIVGGGFQQSFLFNVKVKSAG